MEYNVSGFAREAVVVIERILFSRTESRESVISSLTGVRSGFTVVDRRACVLINGW